MKTRRTPRWTPADEGRFMILSIIEALNPERLSVRNWNELKRLDRIRSARYWASITPSMRRKLRRQQKRDKKFDQRMDELLARLKSQRHQTAQP